MHEKLRTHHQVEIGRRPNLVEIYSTDQAGNVWGEEFENPKSALSVLSKRSLGLGLASSAMLVIGSSLGAYSKKEVASSLRARNVTKLVGSLALFGVSMALSRWEEGIGEMASETADKLKALKGKIDLGDVI
jgi:hypothetical protein